MIYWKNIGTFKIDIKSGSSNSRDDTSLWELGSEVWSGINRTHHIGPYFSLFYSKFYLNTRIVSRNSHPIDSHSAVWSESSLGSIWPVEDCVWSISRNDDIMLYHLVDLPWSHINGEVITSHDCHSSLHHSEIGIYRVITMKILVVPVGCHSEKNDKYCESERENGEKNIFFHMEKVGFFTILRKTLEKRKEKICIPDFTTFSFSLLQW